MIDTTYSCDIIALDKSMGKVYLNPIDKKSIERRDKMTKETLRQTVNTITHLDSMKAVKVAFDLSESNQDSIRKITEVVSLIDSNMKELATKVMKLEKRIEELETKEYERDLNERPKN